jgi:hypothetical protein
MWCVIEKSRRKIIMTPEKIEVAKKLAPYVGRIVDPPVNSTFMEELDYYNNVTAIVVECCHNELDSETEFNARKNLLEHEFELFDSYFNTGKINRMEANLLRLWRDSVVIAMDRTCTGFYCCKFYNNPEANPLPLNVDSYKEHFASCLETIRHDIDEALKYEKEVKKPHSPFVITDPEKYKKAMAEQGIEV